MKNNMSTVLNKYDNLSTRLNALDSSVRKAEGEEKRKAAMK